MKIIIINAMWCPGCLISKSIWNDYDLDEEDIIKYNIGDIVPVVIFEKNNIEIKRVIGEKSKKEILDIMEKILWKRY